MGGLLKSRMAINGYFRNRLTSRFKESSNAVLTTKIKVRTPLILDEIEIRYTYAES
jgi:hypothetical protein